MTPKEQQRTIAIANEVDSVLKKHYPSPTDAPKLFAALTTCIIQNTALLCSIAQSEEAANTTANFLRQVAKQIEADAPRYAATPLPSPEELAAIEAATAHTIGEA